MRLIGVCGIPVFLLAHSAAAMADLYRWVDPASGSVKYSSYPPPWYGKPELERRAPRVEHIPAKAPQPAPEPAASKPAAAKPAAQPQVVGPKPPTADEGED